MMHLLSTKGIARDEAVSVLDTAEDMAAVGEREVKKLPTLRGKTVLNLFFEDSTRTRVSFEAAAKRLSADVLNVAAKGSSVSKGESLKDTVQTLSAIGVDAIVMRHWASGAAHRLAHSGWIQAPVINAGDGTHEHPTQALLDAFTLRRQLHGSASRGRGLDGVRVAIVGDILHSRVARSNLWLLSTLGADVTLVAPPTLMPTGSTDWPGSRSFRLEDSLLPNLDAIMMLRVQAERMNDAYFPNEREYGREWGLTDERFRRMNPKAVVMHPGPMNRGLEISSLAADSSASLVLDQVRNGVSVRMAALYHVMTGTHGIPVEEERS